MQLKDVFPYEICSTFVIRTPLFPISFLLHLLRKDFSSVEYFKQIIGQPIISEALFLASPDFYEQLLKWVNEDDVDKKKEELLIQSIYKYLSRMASRSTPFGLFSGCGVGTIGDDTDVILGKISEYDRHTRLDMSYLCNLAQSLAKNEHIKSQIKYFPNSSIYESGEKLRYIDYQYTCDQPIYQLIEVKYSEFLKIVLIQAKNGKTIEEMCELLTTQNIPLKQSIDFIHSLIQNKILISELDPTVTGEEYLIRIIKILLPIDQIENIKNILYRTSNNLRDIDNQIGNSIEKYYTIASDLDQLGIKNNIKYLFQTDINVHTSKCSISFLTLQSIKEGIIIFNKLTPKNNNNNISEFIEAFIKRYGTRECSLLKVLDTETGIGYLQKHRNSGGDISQIIKDIIIPSPENNYSNLEWNKIQKLLQSKFLESIKNDLYEIAFTEEDIKYLDDPVDNLPATFSCLVSFVEGPSERYPEGRILMERGVGSNAPQLLGRFCHGNKQLLDFVKEITAFEREYFGESLLAEIVHLPAARVGNVILRPNLQDYEIPFLALPSVDKEFAITLDDLYISIINHEIVLRSKKFNKKIIPRMCNAHNYSQNALPVYQFLCDLQNQNIRSSIGFKWGSLAENYSFKPRIIYRNLILSSASWLIKKEEILNLCTIKDNNELIREVQIWRQKNKLPEMVLFEQADNKLLISLNNIISIRTLFSLIKNIESFTLKEFLFSPDNAVVKSDEGAFTNELLFTFNKTFKNVR